MKSEKKVRMVQKLGILVAAAVRVKETESQPLPMAVTMAKYCSVLAQGMVM
jgi:hypothetical protein